MKNSVIDSKDTSRFGINKDGNRIDHSKLVLSRSPQTKSMHSEEEELNMHPSNNLNAVRS